MAKDVIQLPFERAELPSLDELGARRMIAAALRAEADEYVAALPTSSTTRAGDASSRTGTARSDG